MKEQEYQEVASDDEMPLEERERSRLILRSTQPSLSPYPWKITTLVLAVLVVILLSCLAVKRKDDYAEGFDTEFGSAKSAIEVTKVRFGGSLRYTKHGALYVDYADDQPRYFGKPSEEIDLAWRELIGPHMQVQVSEDERTDFQPASFKHPIDGALIGPDVLHSLHCVNNIRMLFDSEHYLNRTRTELKKVHRLHFEHCLNHIRQLIQCHMDITPVTSEYFGSVNTVVGNFDQVHTCRNISKLREWVADRWSQVESTSSKKTATYSVESSFPSHGYIHNSDARLPWNEAHGES